MRLSKTFTIWFIVNFWKILFLLLLQFPFLLPCFSYTLLFQFQQLLINQYFRKHLYKLLWVILIHNQVKAIVISTTTLLIFETSSSWQICWIHGTTSWILLPGVICTVLDDITLSPRNVHHTHRFYDPSICSDVFSASPSVTAIVSAWVPLRYWALRVKSGFNSLIHWLDQRGGVQVEKHQFDIGM
jgi:hypothetical protein